MGKNVIVELMEGRRKGICANVSWVLEFEEEKEFVLVVVIVAKNREEQSTCFE